MLWRLDIRTSREVRGPEKLGPHFADSPTTTGGKCLSFVPLFIVYRFLILWLNTIHNLAKICVGKWGDHAPSFLRLIILSRLCSNVTISFLRLCLDAVAVLMIVNSRQIMFYWLCIGLVRWWWGCIFRYPLVNELTFKDQDSSLLSGIHYLCSRVIFDDISNAME